MQMYGFGAMARALWQEVKEVDQILSGVGQTCAGQREGNGTELLRCGEAGNIVETHRGAMQGGRERIELPEQYGGVIVVH